jgi:hypothetical protein
VQPQSVVDCRGATQRLRKDDATRVSTADGNVNGNIPRDAVVGTTDVGKAQLRAAKRTKLIIF